MEKGNAKTAKQNLINRREFVAGGAALAAFTLIKPGLVYGSEANSKVKVGCIGLGQRGSLLAGMIAAHGGYEIAAVCDYFEHVTNAAGERFNVAKDKRFWGLKGYKRLIESGVDAVFLETPPYCFPEHAKAAVDAGCHVFIAKPLGCDVPGCLSIAESAKKSQAAKKVFLCDFQTRTDEFFIEAIKRVQRGDIGKVALLSSIYTDYGFSDPPKTSTIESRFQNLIWVNDLALGGGYLVNAGIHAIDVGLWIAQSRPIAAMGHSSVGTKESNGDSHRVFSLTYEFDNGIILNHFGEHLNNRHGFRSECYAYCQEGHLATAYAGQVRMLGNSTGYGGGKDEGMYNRGAERNIATFHKSISEGIYDNPTVKPSVDATLVTILGREAGNRGIKLTLEQVMKENKRLEVDYTGCKE